MFPRARRLTAAVAVLAVAMTAGGCSSAAPAAPAQPAAGPASSAEIDVVAEVYRSRIDPAGGGIQLSVRNEGAVPLTIMRAVLDSPALASPIERDRESEIGPGQTRDLAMTLTTAACPAASIEPPDALLTALLADGTAVEVRVTTTDRLGQWADWLAAECIAAAVTDRASITVRHDPTRDDGTLIGLRLDIESRAAGLELVALNDTVLFGLVEPAGGARVTSVTLSDDGNPGIGADGRGEASIPLLLTPARCDAHALADDKQGTLFRLDVLLDGEPGSVTITADAATRVALYDAFTRACGL